MTQKVNSDIFIKNFTPESAYLLGFIWADGYLIRNEIRVECVKTDIDTLFPVFNKTGVWNQYDRTRPNRKPQSNLYTANTQIYEFLQSCDYKAKTNKSADVILNKIPKNLHHYWFRGLFDGDGCWYINTKNKAYQASIAGGYEQDWSYLENKLKELNIKFSLQRRELKVGSKMSVIRLTSRTACRQFGEYIYKNYEDDNIGLSRKKEKWNKIIIISQ